jgi:crossover junction endodeoxyribonuclease RuvC
LQVFLERILKMLLFAFDPGKSGAWAAITHTGEYHTCGDYIFHDRGLDTEMVWGELCLARDGQDCEVVVEAVHSMPRDGVRQAFSFGSSFGSVLALAQRFRAPWHLVPPHQWKRDLGLTSDKEESLIMAREIWPAAPLLRKKDNGRAEALLIALWYKRKFIDGAE